MRDDGRRESNTFLGWWGRGRPLATIGGLRCGGGTILPGSGYNLIDWKAVEWLPWYSSDGLDTHRVTLIFVIVEWSDWSGDTPDTVKIPAADLTTPPHSLRRTQKWIFHIKWQRPIVRLNWHRIIRVNKFPIKIQNISL